MSSSTPEHTREPTNSCKLLTGILGMETGRMPSTDGGKESVRRSGRCTISRRRSGPAGTRGTRRRRVYKSSAGEREDQVLVSMLSGPGPWKPCAGDGLYFRETDDGPRKAFPCAAVVYTQMRTMFTTFFWNFFIPSEPGVSRHAGLALFCLCGSPRFDSSGFKRPEI